MDALNGSNQNHTQIAAKAILEALRGIRYGSVEITIHESRVVQIERKEKIRLDTHGSDKATLSKSA